MVKREVFVITAAAVEGGKLSSFDVELFKLCFGGGKRGDCAVAFCCRQIVDSYCATAAAFFLFRIENSMEVGRNIFPQKFRSVAFENQKCPGNKDDQEGGDNAFQRTGFLFLCGHTGCSPEWLFCFLLRRS
ncbi:hypothetical protein H206_06253 [Candidatus Electrothrix aarhusensis]|uniref:Uncharacterized protein n=1 Tax=Candidatus Electrothrix aarhusensis TaxID=1859131 RepID=A0A3S3QTU0_9BACT|nr:hypothetical protein H206_06253 [Candidatus Electrothrix aarhusensis]